MNFRELAGLRVRLLLQARYVGGVGAFKLPQFCAADLLVFLHGTGRLFIRRLRPGAARAHGFPYGLLPLLVETAAGVLEFDLDPFLLLPAA